MAATMYYYAYLNDKDIVEQIFDMPAPITSPQYISIPSHDETLIGKRYNRETGEFETVTWHYYAFLNEKDIVTEVTRNEKPLPVIPDNVIVIQSYDISLVGKWYNRQTGQFSEPPIHVLAELSTDQINVGTQDKWLTDKLGELEAAAVPIENQVSATDRQNWDDEYIKSFDFRVLNQELTDSVTVVSIPFDTGRPGYIPQKVVLQFAGKEVSGYGVVDNVGGTNVTIKRNKDGSESLYAEFTQFTREGKDGELVTRSRGGGYAKDITEPRIFSCRIKADGGQSHMGTLPFMVNSAVATAAVANIQIGTFELSENNVTFIVRKDDGLSNVRLAYRGVGYVF